MGECSNDLSPRCRLTQTAAEQFWPPLARAMTQFRFEGLAAAEKQASVFGYRGAQFPWCTVSFGRSSGCCSGHGGFELCL